MIHYSTSLRANPVKPEEPKKAYATAQCSEVINLKKFSAHIASHGTAYSRADIAAILTMAVDCLKENLLEGKRIILGDLGTFYVSLQSLGAASLKEFTAANITAVNVNWSPGEDFVDLLSEAEFDPVPPRKATAALLKAHKNGETTVDLTTTTDGSSSSSSDDSSSSSTGGDGTSSSDSGTSTGGTTTDDDNDAA